MSEFGGRVSDRIGVGPALAVRWLRETSRFPTEPPQDPMWRVIFHRSVEIIAVAGGDAAPRLREIPSTAELADALAGRVATGRHETWWEIKEGATDDLWEVVTITLVIGFEREADAVAFSMIHGATPDHP
jgi:hypothetical protein